MALQIAQWNLQYDCSSISPTGNKAVSILGPTGGLDLVLPVDKDVLIKKISVDCIYNTPGNDILKYYSIFFRKLHRDRALIENDRFILINPSVSPLNLRQFLSLDKNQPVKNVNEFFGGLRIMNNVFDTSSLIFNQTTNNLTSVSFLISIYYE
jgi:hypothetical protein